MRSVYCCARRVTVQALSAARSYAWIDSRLDTAKICSDGRVDVDHARLRVALENKNVLTRPGPFSDLRSTNRIRPPPEIGSRRHTSLFGFFLSTKTV
jgi:hypothetical protein